MTTPSTPAGWYPDPEGTGGQRYWDGFAWTEHRAPAPAPSTAPDESADEFPAGEQETSVESLLEQPTTVVPRETSRPQTPDREDSAPSGAHRAPDAEPEPTQPAAPSFDTPVTPTSEPPSTPSWEVPPTPSWETPPLPSWETPPLPPWDTPSTPSDEPPSTPSDEPPSTPSWEAPSAPTDDAPSTPPYGTPSYAASSYDAPQAEAPSAYAGLSGPPAPRGPGGPGGGPDNRKLIIGFLSAVGALLLILVLVLVYAFVIRDDKTTQIAAPGTSTSASPTTTSSEPSETSTESEATESPAPPAGNQATEGDFAFSVASTDSGDTVTSPINEYIEKTANGEFFVVYLNVGNSGSAPLTFLSTLQQLKADADTFTPDDEASFYLGGGVVTINPGEQVETAVAFDVPVGTTPTSIQVHGEPGGAGVELPV
jgi:Domain of unknown function (DUF4352)/Protein of unknown function (DUF2510)/Mid2 like cell wall stress sensor